jgi:hypothetical protein
VSSPNRLLCSQPFSRAAGTHSRGRTVLECQRRTHADPRTQAFGSFLRLRAHPIIAARDFYYSYVIYQEEIKEARGANYFSRLKDCFTVRAAFRAIFLNKDSMN